MKLFSYVTKNEYSEFRGEILDVIKNLNISLKGGYTFAYNPVGSVEDNMVTWVEDSKQGFDFDYNLVLQMCYVDDPNIIVDDFFSALQKISRTRGFRTYKRTHVIKIVRFDKRFNCELSCDLAIVRNENNCREIVTHDKHNHCYIWNKLSQYKHAKAKLKEIKKEHLLNPLRDEYLKLKNNNKTDKCSYMLRLEAISNIFNNYSLSKKC